VSEFAREPWGKTSSGEPVELFTVESGAVLAHLASFGATLVSLEVPDRHGERANIVLGFDTLAEYESPANPYFGALVGRCANRIAGARFTLDGREHVLTANEGRNHLHGGRRGFDRRAWSAKPRHGGGVTFRLRSPDGDEGYPARLEVTASYALPAPGAEHPMLGVQLLAHAGAPTLCNLTQHSYFNLAGSGTILEHELEIHASRTVIVNDELLPTGELARVDGTPFDFRTPCRIGERIGALATAAARGYDVCFVLDDFHAATLRDPHSGRTLAIHTNQPGLQLYTGNRLGSLAVRGGVVPPRFGAVCLETQGLPDAVHHAQFPSVVLRPGEPYHSITTWLFSAE
jgi:aldose 1-epimerase